MLVKFMLNEVNDEERLQVANWIAQSEQNRKYFNHFELIWQNSKLIAQASSVDEDAAWQRFQNRINQTNKPAVVIPIRRRFNWQKVAAIFIVAISVLSLFLIVNSRKSSPLNLASFDRIVKDTLPDNSIVTLNKHSSLKYEERNGENSSRQAILKGEGFFNVSPDKTKPFIIQVDGIEVKVVGTSFNIKSLADHTEIIVESGIVSVSKNNKLVTLVKGEKLVVPHKGNMPVKEKITDKLYNYYRSREFVCDNTPLWKLVEVLNEAYGTNIIIEKKSARNLPLTTTYNNEPIDHILTLLAETFDLTVERKGDRIILK